jgi:hypothetical protein
MSTRCQIVVEGSGVAVYRHSDGYPNSESGVLASLCPLVSKFMKLRGWDESYMSAHIVANQIELHHKWAKSYSTTNYKNDKERQKHIVESSMFTGFGLDAYNPTTGEGIHGDCEYIYFVRKDGIEVRIPAQDNQKIEDMELMAVVGFDGKVLSGTLS